MSGRLHGMAGDAGEPLSADSDELVPTAGKGIIKLPDVANLSAER